MDQIFRFLVLFFLEEWYGRRLNDVLGQIIMTLNIFKTLSYSNKRVKNSCPRRLF